MGLHLNDGGDDLVESHEINVTPFIDVMLVLLIIFMVAAPLATVDIKVDLPASSAEPQPRPDKPVYLTVKEDKNLYLGDTQVTKEQLGQAEDKVVCLPLMLLLMTIAYHNERPNCPPIISILRSASTLSKRFTRRCWLSRKCKHALPTTRLLAYFIVT